MAWVRVDEEAPSHEKIQRVGLQAFGLYVAALCYANRFLTDGVIKTVSIDALFPGVRRSTVVQIVARLVDAGLWEKRDDGWVIHDYHQYQPARTEVLEERRRRHELGTLGGKIRSANAARIAGRFTSRKTSGPAGVPLVASPADHQPSGSSSLDQPVPATTSPVPSRSRNRRASISTREIVHTPAPGPPADDRSAHAPDSNSDRTAPDPTPIGNLVAGAIDRHSRRAADRVAALKRAEGKAPVTDPPSPF